MHGSRFCTKEIGEGDVGGSKIDSESEDVGEVCCKGGSGNGGGKFGKKDVASSLDEEEKGWRENF